MVNRNELRVGCWVDNLQGLPIRCTWENIKWNQDINPIPITPEVLDGCGAIKIAGEYQLKIGALSMTIRFNAGHVYSEIECIYLGDRIKYLHELQNFKLSMCNQELIYQP